MTAISPNPKIDELLARAAQVTQANLSELRVAFTAITTAASAAARSFAEHEFLRLPLPAMVDLVRRFPKGAIRPTPQGLVRWEPGEGNRAWRRYQKRLDRKGRKQRLR